LVWTNFKTLHFWLTKLE